MSQPGQLAFSWYGDIEVRTRRTSTDKVALLPTEAIAELRGALTVGPDKVELVLRPLGIGGALARLLHRLADVAAASPANMAEPPPLVVPESRSKTGRDQAKRYGRCTKEDTSCVDLRMAAHSLEVARNHMAAAQRWSQVKDDIEAARHLKATRIEALAQADNARSLIDEVLVRFNWQPSLRKDE